jgi:hypothetical protein
MEVLAENKNSRTRFGTLGSKLSAKVRIKDSTTLPTKPTAICVER